MNPVEPPENKEDNSQGSEESGELRQNLQPPRNLSEPNS
jgi:hypothetical protein